MSSFVRVHGASPSTSAAPIYRLAGLAAVLLVAFLLFPGDIAIKTHAVLHGLCAQRPSHSLTIGGNTLPLDARMTGIYLGAAATGAWLFAAGRLQSTARLSRPTISLLAFFVAAMALDGLNSFLVDLGALSIYPPSNILRLVTGIFAGTALGIAMVHLLAISLWSTGHKGRAVVTRPAELFVPLVASGALGGLAISGLPTLYAPFATGLIVATVTVFWMLAVVLIALVANRSWTYQTPREVAPLAGTALIASVVLIGALAIARFVAEHYLGLPKLT